MSKITPSQKNLILILSLIIIFVLSLFLVIFPLTNHIKNIYQDYLNQNAELTILRDKIKTLKNYKDIEDQIKTTNKDFLQFIPNDAESEDVMVTLTALANDTGNILTTLNIESADKSQDSNSQSQFAQKKLTINLSGNLNSILDFVKKAGKLKRFNQIASITLSTDQNGNLSANILMSIFYQKP